MYAPRPAPGFRPERIVLTKGSLDTAERRGRGEAIRAAYPGARVERQLDVPHNRVEVGTSDLLQRHRRGKRTLVLGVHNSAVARSREEGNCCPNYWHVSPYGFCPFGCHYCYLAGTPGVRFSPTVKVFLNLDEMLARIDREARRIGEPTAFYLGKLQDGLALDPLTGYSRELVPFFARHPFARHVVLTKSTAVENLLELDHRSHTILSWSLNPPEVVEAFEANTPPTAERIAAMRRCAEAGYPIRAVVMPIVPVPDWPVVYERFLDDLLTAVPLHRLTLGGICSYPAANRLMRGKIGREHAIDAARAGGGRRDADGRARYPVALRIEMYRHLVAVVRGRRRDLPVGLCLESRPVFEALELTASIGRCNCVW